MSTLGVLRFSVLFSVLLTAGCAQEPAPQPLAPIIVKSMPSDFCQIMIRIFGPVGPTWGVADTPESITTLDRLEAAFRAKKCAPLTPSTPIS